MKSRINFIVEGQTEEQFVNTALRDYFLDQSIIVAARLITTQRRRRARHIIYRGGLTTYRHAYDDIRQWVLSDRSALCTTMFDLYGLPDDFPGYEEASRASDPYTRVEILETSLYEDINSRRFIPYFQLHEFESLLFSDLRKISTQFPEYSAEIHQLEESVKRFNSPELVNDGIETAPSKRIIASLPEYANRKASAGPTIAGKIGLPVLQSKCRHFRAWLERLSGACT